MEVQEKGPQNGNQTRPQVNTIQGNRSPDRRKHEMLTEHLGVTKTQSDFKAKWPTYIQWEKEETLKKYKQFSMCGAKYGRGTRWLQKMRGPRRGRPDTCQTKNLGLYPEGHGEPWKGI